MKKSLGLFFTRGVSLGTWAQVGNLTRELAIYKRLLEQGYEVNFVTYGDSSDLEYGKNLSGIKVICNETGMSPEKYETEMVNIHEDKFREFSAIKTNQIYGADIALNVARKYCKPFIARCGYLWSVNAAKENGKNSWKAVEADRIERLAFSGADAISVTTKAMKEDIVRRLPDCEIKIRIIPNYVDTGMFKPINCEKIPNQIIFIGRLAPEKNLVALFEAIKYLDVKLVIVGDGPERENLETGFPDLQDKILWLGNVPNTELPLHINRSAIFILPSFYEGHPKALIEAMSCQAAVIGCDSPGVREIIINLNNGILSGHDSTQLYESIKLLLGDHELASQLGKQARKFVIDHYDLDKIVTLESQMLCEIM